MIDLTGGFRASERRKPRLPQRVNSRRRKPMSRKLADNKPKPRPTSSFAGKRLSRKPRPASSTSPALSARTHNSRQFAQRRSKSRRRTDRQDRQEYLDFKDALSQLSDYATTYAMETLREAILACNDGNAFLTESRGADGEPRIHAVAAPRPLPRTHTASCAFHSVPAFVRAVREKSAFAVFPTPSGNTLVVPTKPFTSIRDFARRATDQEFAGLFRAVAAARASANRRTGQQHWIETIGYDVPHLHVRIVAKRVHRSAQR